MIGEVKNILLLLDWDFTFQESLNHVVCGTDNVAGVVKKIKRKESNKFIVI